MIVQNAGQKIITIPSGFLDVRHFGPKGAAVAPYVIFNGTSTKIVCGSDASLDDLHDETITVEAWIKTSVLGGTFIDKDRWEFRLGAQGVEAVVYTETTPAVSYSGTDEINADGAWHHLAMYYNDAGTPRRIYIAIDGVWVTSYATHQSASGAVRTDASKYLTIGKRADDGNYFQGSIGWVRISDNDRYNHEVDFSSPSRLAYPDADGNTIEQWNMSEGTGTKAAALINSPANDGAITSGSWGMG